ncbi:hypothetical protein [Streptomyces globisporus]|uniref:hypothetical protein n=1 Tax=Streptomyces globisporus TaxID=1908 RepID=UPI0004CA8F15|nr:hypothetical protein [Streptomyces globisporus]
MFEIRIVCDPADADRITTVLAQTFTTGPVRTYTARSTDKTRLYVTADHPAAVEWPTPEQAYADAPSILDEIGWTVRTLADDPLTANTGREFWLRKAALLDRIALGDEVAPAVTDATVTALQAARQLMDFDDAAVICDPRHYVRQQYARQNSHH